MWKIPRENWSAAIVRSSDGEARAACESPGGRRAVIAARGERG